MCLAWRESERQREREGDRKQQFLFCTIPAGILQLFIKISSRRQTNRLEKGKRAHGDLCVSRLERIQNSRFPCMLAGFLLSVKCYDLLCAGSSLCRAHKLWPICKGSKGLNSDSDSVCDCATEFASLACHSRQQLSQLIGFRFISSIFLVASFSSHIHTYVVIYCAKNSKKKKLFSFRQTRT